MFKSISKLTISTSLRGNCKNSFRPVARASLLTKSFIKPTTTNTILTPNSTRFQAKKSLVLSRSATTKFNDESTVAPPTLDEVFAEKPKWMPFYKVLGLIAAISACTYYYIEYRLDTQRFHDVIRMIGSTSPELVEKGLLDLDQVWTRKQRSFGGLTTVYSGRHEMINGGLVEALIRAIGVQSVDIHIRMKALEVLAVLAHDSPVARYRIASGDFSSLATVIDNLGFGDDNTRAALLAGATLLATLEDVDCTQKVADSPAVRSAVTNLAKKNEVSPLKQLLAHALQRELALHDSRVPVGAAADVHAEQQAALDAALKTLVPREARANEEFVAKVADAAGVALFGFVYGRVRWFGRCFTAGTKRPTGEIVRYVARHSRVGVWLGAALLVDAGIAYASRYWTPARQEKFEQLTESDTAKLARWSPVADAPARLALPSVAACVSALLVTTAIRRQTFVILPLSVALAQAHWDVIAPSQVYQTVSKQINDKFIK